MIIILYLFKSYKSNTNYIPKIIWVYWDSTTRPSVVDYCIKKMYKLNPTWKINVLNKNNIKQYIDFDIFRLKHATTPMRISDLIRLEILKKFGGVWCDASIILTKSLDWLHKIQDKEGCNFIGYYIDSFTTNNDFPVIENWFIACTKNNKFIEKWREIFYKINDYESVENYVDKLREKTDIQNINIPYYLSMHIAAQYILQNEISVDERKKLMYLQKAEDGPFYYLQINDWNSKKAIQYLCENINNLHTSLVKLRGIERNILEEEKGMCFNYI